MKTTVMVSSYSPYAAAVGSTVATGRWGTHVIVGPVLLLLGVDSLPAAEQNRCSSYPILGGAAGIGAGFAAVVAGGC